MQSKILILDFGSQFTQLIARRVREIGVFSEVVSPGVSDDYIRSHSGDGSLAGIILTGGSDGAVGENTSRVPQSVFECGVPVLGIGYGMQIMAVQLGGKVGDPGTYESGLAEVAVQGRSALLDSISDSVTAEGQATFSALMSHAARITEVPAGFKKTASARSDIIAGMADEKRQFYGLGFHPEVNHTPQGKAILSRFVLDICAAMPGWNMPDYVEEAIRSIRERVGDERVILGLSGGVDSSVAAVLIHRAIGDQLTCVFVDHGLLRLNEADMVLDMFAKNLGVNVVFVDAAEKFMDQLKGVSDPEEKRMIIGRVFVEVFQAEAEKISNARWLAQGTIYSDVIESASKEDKGRAIKSHHNVGGLPDDLNLKLLEPVRELFKDEVRELGIALGLPAEVVSRHPFPGPGLGVRIVGEIRPHYAEMLRRADAIFTEELKNTPVDSVQAGDSAPMTWYEATSQAFAVFIPVMTVGVSGDARTYEYVIALRAVQTLDFMTAHWAHLPYELLGRTASRIISEVDGINRVVYDVSGKPPATIEWE